jgi:L-alanine-DL-glutamate epimerase-like enolase superfamily enzyme
MKIIGVEAIEIRLPEEEVLDKASCTQNSLIIKIHTDEGITGCGEVDSAPRVSKAVVDAPFSHSNASGLGRILLGMNPLDIKVLNERLYRSSLYYGRRGAAVHVIGGIDIALWDIAGKYYNQPVYQLLGGAFRKKIRAYASILFGRDGGETEEIGRRWVGKGFTAVKFGWGPMGQEESLDIELVAGARRGVGDKNDVLVDAGCCWTAATAIRRSQQFEEFRIGWLEEPLEGDDVEGYARLTRVSRVPIAAGENDAGRFALRDFIERSGIDIVQIDLARNGFSESVRVADFGGQGTPGRQSLLLDRNQSGCRTALAEYSQECFLLRVLCGRDSDTLGRDQTKNGNRRRRLRTCSGRPRIGHRPG